MTDTPLLYRSRTPVQKRVIAIDYGHVRIGLAISDSSRRIAQPLETIQGDKKPEKAARKTHHALSLICQNKGYSIDTIVIGLPLNLNGTESERSHEARLFRDALTLFFPDLHITLFDERFTSLQAERSMKEQGLMRRKERAQKVDSVSCLILLQSYLDSLMCNLDIQGTSSV